MKKLITAILSIILVAMGAMLIFAQDTTANKDGKRGHFGKRGGHRAVLHRCGLADDGNLVGRFDRLDPVDEIRRIGESRARHCRAQRVAQMMR